MGLLDLFFPKRCVACGSFGTYLCEEDRLSIRAGKDFCPICLKSSVLGFTHSKCKRALGLDGLVCVFYYKSPIKDLLHELKYKMVRDLLETLLLETKRSKKLSEYDFTGFDLIPIPLFWQKKNWRGFNQTEEIGKRIAKLLKIKYLDKILVKSKSTPPQAKLARQARMVAVEKSFNALADLHQRKILLFDDVWTTGATMKEAAKVLKRKGAVEVWGLVIASGHRL
jgi:ComF family protein